MNIYEYTPEQMREARDWVMDCVINPEDVEYDRPLHIIRYIERYYEGGWDQFLENCAE